MLFLELNCNNAEFTVKLISQPKPKETELTTSHHESPSRLAPPEGRKQEPNANGNMNEYAIMVSKYSMSMSKIKSCKGRGLYIENEAFLTSCW